ncbi:hypothetical protein PG995_004337 [Apiospora arundinis]
MSLTTEFGRALPTELMLKVLEQLDPSQRPTCAAVCRSWQAIVERSTFDTLVLQPADLPYIRGIMCGYNYRLPLLKHVVYRVPVGDSLQFPDPEDSDDGWPEDRHSRIAAKYRQRQRKHMKKFKQAIELLFAILSNFNGKQCAFRLDIATVGTDHAYRKRTVQRQGLTQFHILGIQSQRQITGMPYEHTPWVEFRRDHYLRGGEITPHGPVGFNCQAWKSFALSQWRGHRSYYNTLPMVNAVTEFRISSQCFHYIGDVSRSMMMRSLPNLRHVTFEKWPEEYPGEWRSELSRLDWFGAMLPNWPQSLKSIYLFQLINDSCAFEDEDGFPPESPLHDKDTKAAAALGWMNNRIDLLRWSEDWMPTMRQLYHKVLPKHLALRSLGMEELGVCYLIDADRVFATFDNVRPLPLWPDLRILVLTANLLPEGGAELGGEDPERGPEYVQTLLKRVAALVPQMPKLQVLELWEADVEYGGAAFQYSALGPNPGATARWVSTFDMKIDDDVKAAWESIVVDEGHYHVEFLPEKISNKFRGPVDFIARQLLSAGKILDPETLRTLTMIEMRDPDLEEER